MKSIESSDLISRRTAILAGGVAVLGFGWYGVPIVQRLVPVSFSFKPVPGVPGFRLLNAGEVTRNLDPFIGLDSLKIGRLEEGYLDRGSNFCDALFGTVPRSSTALTIASFSDYHCPYCRILTPILADWQAANPKENHVEWHEWPLLGETSVIAARAALAAKRQNAYPDLHRRLMRSSFVPSDAYLRDAARTLNLDADQLVKDTSAPSIDRELAVSSAVAVRFGFPGTPSLVVGKTAVIGAISEHELYALIDLERSEGPVAGCSPA